MEKKPPRQSRDSVIDNKKHLNSTTKSRDAVDSRVEEKEKKLQFVT
jgi:hypothetical protein